MRNVTKAIAPRLAILLSASQAVAQQGSAELRGRVLDNTGGALPGVTVTVRNQASGVYRNATSTADGAYFMTGLIPGVYELTAEMPGFRKYSRKDLRLEVGKTATVDVQLEVGGIQEELVVTAEAPIVDVTSKEVGGNITSQDLLSLPSVNRNFIGFIGLLPGVVPSISTESFGSDSVNVNGQDARNNNYLMDGGQQQRRRHRAARGHPGPPGPGGRPGVPGPDQPIRRRVRPHRGRDGQRRVQAGGERLPRLRLLLPPGRVDDVQGLLRRAEEPDQAGHALPAVRLHRWAAPS